MPSHRQDDLFPDLEPSPEIRITLRPSSGKPLTAIQKRFERELRRVESLRSDYDRVVAQWNAFLRAFEKEIHPAELEMNRQRLSVIQALAAYWDQPRSFGKKQRPVVLSILVDQVGAACAAEPELLARLSWLSELKNRLERAHREILEEGRKTLVNELESLPPEEKEMGEEMFTQFVESLGLDPDTFSIDMDPEAFAQEIQRQVVEGSRTGERPPAGGPGRQTAAQRRATEKAAQRENARKRSLSTIYKDLAKAIHPDLEPDPAVRARKEKVMQELTSAYRNNDLHTMLRLELEWLEGEDQRLASLADDKLRIYLDVLKEQSEALREDIESVMFEPRFGVVSRFAKPWIAGPENVLVILDRIRRDTRLMEECASELTGPRGKETVRRVVRERQQYDRTLKERDFPF